MIKMIDTEAHDFLWRFLLQREANRDFYRSVPAEKRLPRGRQERATGRLAAG